MCYGHFLAKQNTLDRLPNMFGTRGTSGYEMVNFHDFVAGVHIVQKFGDVFVVGNDIGPNFARDPMDLRLFESFFERNEISHGRNAPHDCALAKDDEDVAFLSEFPEDLHVL